jgi:polyisoprenoid-binding protein YceI
VATTQINRQDFGVRWQDSIDRGGIVVSDEIDIAIDVEAILEDA